jgi:hypothetical protein
MIMDPYVINQLFTDRRNDLIRDADESRLARDAHEDSQPAPLPAPRPTRSRRLSFAR